MKKIRYKRGVIVERDETGEDKIEIDAGRMGKVKDVDSHFEFEDDKVILEKRMDGDFEGKAFYLTATYDWVLCEDNKEVVCLIPLKKETE